MKRLVLTGLCALFPLAAFGQVCVPSDGLWAKPRSGAAVLAEPGVRACVLAMLDAPGTRLVLRHLPDEDAASRAAELRWWLIALGLAPERIRLQEETSALEALVMELTETK